MKRVGCAVRLGYSEICSILGVTADSADVPVTGVVYDSREVTPGVLFACIPGEVTDGHLYAAQAVEKGASVLLVEKDIPAQPVPVIRVPNTLAALETLASAWREKTQATVIGVTGTCGKTTVKEMLASILARCGKTAKSPANHNNQLGMACGILNTDGDERFWVFEAGISRVGDMDALGSMLKPDRAVIVNIGSGHTEGLGERGVAWHKAQLLTHLREGGLGIVSADYPELAWKALGTHREVVFFSGKAGVAGDGLSRSQANYASWLGSDENGDGLYELSIEGKVFQVRCPCTGAWAAENLIAAALAAHTVSATTADIMAGLGSVVLPKQRFVRERLDDILLIDDTYNANPLSMTCAVKEAARLAREEERPLVFLLGEMRELGSEALPAHRELGRLVAEIAPQAFFWKGGQADSVRKGLDDGGYGGPFVCVDEASSFPALFRERRTSGKGPVLLAKGSHANALDKFLMCLKNETQGA